MAEQTVNSENTVPPEPELRRHEAEPKGVIRKNLKVLLFLGVSGLVALAAIFSASGKKAPSQSSAAQHEPPSRPFRTVRTTMSRISRTSSRPSGKRKHRRQRLKRRRCRMQHCQMARWLSRQPPRPMARQDSRPSVRRANPARSSRTSMCSSSLQNSNKQRNWRPRNENLPTMRASHRIWSTLARWMRRLNRPPVGPRVPIQAQRQPRTRLCLVSRRATCPPLVRAQGRRAMQLTNLLGSAVPKSISIRQRASHMSSTRGSRWTRF